MKNLKSLIVTTVLLASCSPVSAKDFMGSGDTTDFRKWTSLLAREHVDEPAFTYTGDVRKLLDERRRYYKKFRYVEDRELYGVEDYYATRKELKIHKAGDCEDFATAAYFDLVEAGVDERELAVQFVIVKKTGELHAITRAGQWYYDQRSVVLLDEAHMKLAYTPLYHISRLGWARDMKPTN